MNIPLTLTRDGESINIIVVDAIYYPASRGYRNSYGVPEEPDYDACWEWDDITGADGGPVDLTDDAIAMIDGLLEDWAANN